MKTEITNEDLQILNQLLPYFPFNERFALQYVHAQHIIKPKYPRSDGSTDLLMYDKERKEFTESGVYKRLDSFLMENGFAEGVSNNGITKLKLTKKGEVLAAYGNYYALVKANMPSPENEVISRIPELISKIFSHGEFILEVEEPRIQFTNINIFTADEAGELAKIKKLLDPKERIKANYEQSLKDEEVLQYLVQHGFAVNRQDISNEEHLYRQLTDKGRELKELGTLEAYNEKVSKQQEDKDEELAWRKKSERRLANIAERQYQLNWLIAIATMVAGAQAVFQVIEFSAKRSFSLERFIYFILGISTILVFLLIKALLRKR